MAHAEHDGLLGPDSVAWRVLDHPAALVGGLRALVVQSLHPLATAGVAQHSDYKRRPLERLRRTALVAASRVPPLRELYGHALGSEVGDVHLRGRAVRHGLAA